MILIGCDEQGLIRIGLTSQSISALTAVAVQEHGVTLARSGGRSGKVGVLQTADTALVLEQIVAVAACSHKVDPVYGVNDATVSKIANVGLNAFGLCVCVGIISVGTNVIVTCQGA